jgi:flavin reductase (DIM6/NTAB) family NADH-FMN oxidoreductase RutF
MDCLVEWRKPQAREAVTIKPSILYFGTPVVLITTMNPDATVNISPMSSAWAWATASCSAARRAAKASRICAARRSAR